MNSERASSCAIRNLYKEYGCNVGYSEVKVFTKDNYKPTIKPGYIRLVR